MIDVIAGLQVYRMQGITGLTGMCSMIQHLNLLTPQSDPYRSPRCKAHTTGDLLAVDRMPSTTAESHRMWTESVECCILEGREHIIRLSCQEVHQGEHLP